MSSVSGSMMAPRRLYNNKTARGSDDDKEGDKDSKRRCTTTSITTTASFRKQEAATSNRINNLSSAQAVIPNHITFPTEPNNVVAASTNTTNVVVDNSEPPTAVKISDELCKIVFCSRYEGLRALDKLCKWAGAENSAEFLNSFHVNDGSMKVLDFLRATMNDSNCEEPFRMKCIKKAVDVMMLVLFYGEDNDNKEIATHNATSVVAYGGIDTLLNASKEYPDGDDVPQLNVLDIVWCALRNITCCLKGTKGTIGKEQAINLFNASIDMFVQFNPNDSPIVSSILESVFCTLNNLVRYHYVKHIYDTHAVSKCLKDFRMGGNWSEGMTEAAIAFFNSCRLRKLLDGGDDYKMLLPFLVMVLKKFESNEWILTHVLRMIHGACDTIDDQETIEGSGVMEPLVVLLASNDIDKSQKKKVRTVIIKIFNCK